MIYDLYFSRVGFRLHRLVLLQTYCKPTIPPNHRPIFIVKILWTEIFGKIPHRSDVKPPSSLYTAFEREDTQAVGVAISNCVIASYLMSFLKYSDLIQNPYITIELLSDSI